MATTHHIPQDADVQPQEQSGSLDVGDRPVECGERLPAVLTRLDMQRAFRVKSLTFYARLKAGHYDRFEIRPRVGKRTWAGALVERHLNHGGREAFVFGRKRVG